MISLLLAASVAHATTTTYVCPAKVKGTKFVEMGLYYYDPAHNSDVRADETGGIGGPSHTWTFAPTQEVWIGCKYGKKLKLLYKKKFPVGQTSCGSVQSKGRSALFDSLSCD